MKAFPVSDPTTETEPRSLELILNLSCPDGRGIVAAVAGAIASFDGNILESAQYRDTDTDRFFMRVRFAPLEAEANAADEFAEHFRVIARRHAMDWRVTPADRRSRVLLMVSQGGHCLNDLLYRWRVGQLAMDLRGVVSNHTVWRERVEAEGLPFHHLPVASDTKAAAEAALMEIVEEQEIELVVLARYMQVLSEDMTQRMSGRIINIHHSMLPSFKGARPYHQAHARGVKLVGATAHYVTADLDEGPIISQDMQPVSHAMSADDMAKAGRETESRVLADAVKQHLERRVLLNGTRTVVFR